MKKILMVMVGGALLLTGCGKQKADFNPDSCLGKESQQKLLQEMVHYSSKLPPEATHETKFNPEFNWYYDRAVSECRILSCFKRDQDTSYQLLIARKARSITPMEEGIAITVKFDNQQKLKYYQEVFRTWKMPADTLERRGKFLFETMVNGGDLTLYYSKFQRDRYIEFPDDRFTFDIEARKWKDSELDSLELN